jgi:Ca-activated chloride channel family protein
MQSLNPAFILTKGTSLKALFNKLVSMRLGEKQLILITDGGEEKEVKVLRDIFQKSELSLTLLALGSKEGTTVNLPDGSYLKDKEQNLVISRINPMLESLTTLLKGTYLRASNTPAATAKEVSLSLQTQHSSSQKVKKMQRHYFQLYQIPLFLALLLFLMVHTRAVKFLVVLFGLFGFQAHASMGSSLLDTYHLNLAYEHYEKHDFNATLKALHHVRFDSLQSKMALANTYYKQNDFKKSIIVYKSIRSTSATTKQNIYYNIANAYAMQKAYTKAKLYYTKALQLGSDDDSLHNLKHVVFLENQKDASLGIAHPKSQDSSSSKSEPQKEKDAPRDEDAPSSASGAGGESKAKKQKVQNKLLEDESTPNHPLSSKVYELINKGYIHETQPW